MHLKQLYPLVLLASIACVSASSVMSIGPDTYQVIGTSEFGEGSAKEVALKKAHVFGATKGLYVVVIGDRQSRHGDAMRSMSGTMFSCEITFRLVSKDDPDYRRPTPTPSPDVVIENRVAPNPPATSTPLPSTQVTAPQSNSERYDQLLKLKKLLDEKIITEEEYKIEKAKILNQQ